jgi:hypothetical protein
MLAFDKAFSDTNEAINNFGDRATAQQIDTQLRLTYFSL